MNRQLVSIIMPVYNVKKYLKQAAESVLQQTYTELELILIDDGSTDGSGMLCDTIALTDHRVVVLHKANGGAASARNAGLAVANGEWVLMLDSDDYYDSYDAIERLMDFAQCSGTKIVCFDYCRVNEHGQPVKKHTYKGRAIHSLQDMVRYNIYTSSAWLKLVRRDIFEENDLVFEPDIFCEDIEWSLKLMLANEKILYFPERLYCYRIRTASVTQSMSQIYVHDLLHVVKKCRNDCEAYEDADVRNLGFNYTAFQYCTLLINAQLSKPRPKRSVFNDIWGQKDLLRYHLNPIVRLVYITSKVFGIRLTSLFLYGYFMVFGNHV